MKKTCWMVWVFLFLFFLKEQALGEVESYVRCKLLYIIILPFFCLLFFFFFLKYRYKHLKYSSFRFLTEWFCVWEVEDPLHPYLGNVFVRTECCMMYGRASAKQIHIWVLSLLMLSIRHIPMEHAQGTQVLQEFSCVTKRMIVKTQWSLRLVNEVTWLLEIQLYKCLESVLKMHWILLSLSFRLLKVMKAVSWCTSGRWIKNKHHHPFYPKNPPKQP